MNNMLLLKLLLLVSGGLCQLVFRDSPATATVLVGFPTTLRCAASDPTPPEGIVWRKDGVTVDQDARVTVSYDSESGESQLGIGTVSYVDAGGYQCVAVDASGLITAESSLGTLTVHGHPEFGAPLPSIIVPQGGRAEFDCDVISIPPATNISWTYESGGVQSRLTSGNRIAISPPTILVISNVQHSDEGYYICTAENSFGRNTTLGRLTIGTPPPPLSLTVSPGSSVTVVLGNSVVLTCSAPDDVHLTSIQWLRGTTAITVGVARTANSLSLSLSSVQLQDEGSYVCSAVDAAGSNDTVTTTLRVDVPPRITSPPHNFTVLENNFLPSTPSCQGTGVPAPTYSWFGPDGNSIPMLGDVPQFGLLTRSSSGSYACVATNRAGTARAEFNIVVEGPPLLTATPTDTSVSAGHDVIFNCEAVGPPEPTYTWTRVGRTLPPGAVESGMTLHLFSVTTDDAGTYQCTAGNSRGIVQAQATLTILPPPTITRATTTPVFTTVGLSFTLNCSWTGPPNTVQAWSLNGSRLNPATDFRLQTWPNGSLTVSNPTESYTGSYVCNVSTALDFVTSQVSVTVGEPPRISISPSNLDLAPGNTAFLSCVPNGFPQPWTTWFRTNIFGARSQLPSLGDTFTKFSNGLQLHDVSRDDSGTYECRVENRLGSTEQQALVRVEGAPEADSVESVTLNEGATSSNISCQTRFNFPAGTVRWSRVDGQPLPPARFTIGPTGVLIISNVLREDEGEYSCVVENQYGFSTATGTITVNYPPSVSIPTPMVNATLRQAFTLSCPSEGQPRPFIQWTPPDGLNPNSYRTEASGDITVFSASAQSIGVYTCTASNTIGSATGQIEVDVRGQPVSSLTITVLSSSTVFILWDHPVGGGQQSYEIEVQAIGAPQVPVMEFTSSAGTRSRTVLSLAAGKQYAFTVRPIFENGIPGMDFTAAESTRATVPTGPPQNVILKPLGEAFYITWEEPLFEEQGGTISTYDIFYRFTQNDPEAPFIMATAPSITSADGLQSYLLRELTAGQSYEVMVRAVNSVGPGPNSTLVAAVPLPPRSYQPVDLDATRIAIIVVGVFFCGVCIIAITVLLIGILVYVVRRRVKRTGKHETLVEEEEYERRQRRREKRNKIISDPLPGMVEDVDTKKKLSLKSKDGKILSKPKVVRKEDIADKPRPGKYVKKVPRQDTLVSENFDDDDYDSQYDDPADVVESSYHEDDGIKRQKYTDSPRVRRQERQSDDEYSQPIRHTKKKRPPSDYGSEDDEEAPPYHDVYEDVEMPGGESTAGSDDELYASVSAKHKAKKRMKMMEQQQKEDLKEEKKRRKMEEKLERERRKKEEKDRKAAEKKRKEEMKKKSKDEQKRQSLGLGNIVRLQDVDFGSGDAKAQAEFIDSATAALF